MSNRVLSAQLRASDPAALELLRDALRRHGGSVQAAIRELGLPSTTLYDLRRDVPAVRAVLDEESMGRAGAAARAAVSARKTRVISRGSEKNQKK